MSQVVQNFIGGKWIGAASGETFESHNPATEELLATAPRSSAEDVNAAVQAAKTAYKSWRLVPAPRRGEILFRVAQILSERKDDIAR